MGWGEGVLALPGLLKLPMVAVESALNRLLRVDDFTKRSGQSAVHFRPMGDVGTWTRMRQCLLDSSEVGSLPGFDRSIHVGAEGGPAEDPHQRFLHRLRQQIPHEFEG